MLIRGRIVIQVGFEPTPYGLRVRSSTTEVLDRREVGSPMGDHGTLHPVQVGMETHWSSACSILDCSDLHSRARTALGGTPSHP